ncbi:hypothetical protein RZS08_18385, partial [Arthrospira platensis SPKY1]|nr:hypothetical protein [Arthrospira platensis SPKY1]
MHKRVFALAARGLGGLVSSLCLSLALAAQPDALEGSQGHEAGARAADALEGGEVPSIDDGIRCDAVG